MRHLTEILCGFYFFKRKNVIYGYHVRLSDMSYYRYKNSFDIEHQVVLNRN